MRSGLDHINRVHSDVAGGHSETPGPQKNLLYACNMTSVMWGLVFFFGVLAPGTLGIVPHARSQRRQIHSAGLLNPRASPKVKPVLYERFEDIRSTEQVSDELPTAETFQEVQLGGYGVRGFQQAGANNYLSQEGQRAGSGGWFVDAACSLVVHIRDMHDVCHNHLLLILVSVRMYIYTYHVLHLCNICASVLNVHSLVLVF